MGNLKERMLTVGRKMHRRQKVRTNDMQTKLDRCLTLFDLVFIALSFMVSGIFVVANTIIHSMAGPGIILSYTLAGLAAMMSAFSYAEMGSRVPRTGSTYVYVTIGLGEIWGFLAGWNVISEYALMSAAMGRAFTSTLELMAGGANFTQALNVVSFTIGGERTDLVAACIVIFFTVIVGLGVKLTNVVNITFNMIAIILVIIVSGVSFGYGNVANWNKHGLSSFFPYGAGGVVAGAAACYFSYIGFECVTISGEETKDPKRSVPLAILISFILVTFLYIFSSLGFTYITPYKEFNPLLPLPSIFLDRHMLFNGITLGIGSLLSVCTNMIMGLYAVPRIFYAMASDGLIYSWLGKINQRTQTPIWAMVATGVIVALVTFFLNMSTIIQAVSIGTLSSYILVAMGVLMLRYEPKDEDQELRLKDPAGSASKIFPGERRQWAREHWFLSKYWPHVAPKKAVLWMVFNIFLFTVTEMAALRLGFVFTVPNAVFALLLFLPIILWMLHLTLYEQNKPDEGTFRMPWMPLIPVLSIIMNMQFMFMLSWFTWVRLVVWVILGLIIYFTYGIKNSKNTVQSLLTDDEPPSYGSIATANGAPTETAAIYDTKYGSLHESKEEVTYEATDEYLPVVDDSSPLPSPPDGDDKYLST